MHVEEVQKAIEMIERRDRAPRRYCRKKVDPHSWPIDEDRLMPEPELAPRSLEKRLACHALASQQRAE